MASNHCCEGLEDHHSTPSTAKQLFLLHLHRIHESYYLSFALHVVVSRLISQAHLYIYASTTCCKSQAAQGNKKYKTQTARIHRGTWSSQSFTCYRLIRAQRTNLAMNRQLFFAIQQLWLDWWILFSCWLTTTPPPPVH